MNADFSQIQREIFGLYGQKRLEEALMQTRRARRHFPGQAARLTFWEACFLSLLERPQEALGVLQAGLEEGLWWNPERLQQDADLAGLQELPEFKTLLEVCQTRKQQAQLMAQPRLRVFPPPNPSTPAPLLLAFHMRGSNLEETAPHWQPLSQHGVLLALLQSGQVEGPWGYCWDDYAQAKQEAQQAYTLLQTQHPLSQTLVLAGASQGAGLAVRLTLEQALPSRGFVAVVGAGALEPLLPHLEAAVQKGLKGVFITGEDDPARAHITLVANELKAQGLQVRLEVVKGLGHDYPPDFAERLVEALRFVHE
ncbi:hypothetical protein DV704_01995 [Meiothermus sp. QL-1]|uniref:alpha/beta hydrolase n=1 Tax=Meiothermus sp. QL-1 TaxID=2058095 RepID=UPI000E0BE70B|nr:hypothetical protein [Meiothermus sp. QL-1]RDI96606.1 hypothetical protein DV704_01995 [Meiothermus sp. QL-1]